MSRQFKLNKTSNQKINSWLNKLDIQNKDSFFFFFSSKAYYDCKMIKDCSEKSIVDFYIETATELLQNE